MPTFPTTTSSTSATRTVTVTTVGGPTALIDLAGLRVLVDPTFDPPGTYELGGGRFLTKTRGPAVSPARIGAVDLVLLSHDQHADNLDHAGREVVAAATQTLTTPMAAHRLGGAAHAMPTWTTRTVKRPDGGELHITAVPAQHGPDGIEALTGPVTGFVIHGDEVPTIYVSGDNASLALVADIADRFPGVDVALVFAGATQTALLGEAFLTLTSAQVVEVALAMPNACILPVHCDGWSHFTEPVDEIVAAFERARMIDRLVHVPHGVPTVFAAGSRRV